jgi:hypothetical protein
LVGNVRRGYLVVNIWDGGFTDPLVEWTGGSNCLGEGGEGNFARRGKN